MIIKFCFKEDVRRIMVIWSVARYGMVVWPGVGV